MDARIRAIRIIAWSETPAAPGLRRLKRLPLEIERGLNEAYAEGHEDGVKAERARRAAERKGPDPVAEWGRRLAGDRLLTDQQALEWLEAEALRRSR